MSHSSIAIDLLPLNPNLISKLKNANLFSLKKILNFSLSELECIVKVSTYEARLIVQAVCIAELKSSVEDVLTMYKNPSREFLPFEFLHYGDFNYGYFGGVYTGTITEIYGESGCGKTQICLQICMSALLPKHLGGNSKVVYIHSEEFPIQRFIDLSKSFKRRNAENEELQKLNFTDNLILKKVYNLKETIRVLQKGIPELMEKEKIPKVIVIDSVASLLRGEYDSLTVRNEMIEQLGSELWQLAHIYHMAVFCVNQVSFSLQKSTSTSSVISTDIPSLGLLWANILTTRVKLYRRQRETSVVRALEVEHSAYHPRLHINFVITEDGFEYISEHLL